MTVSRPRSGRRRRRPGPARCCAFARSCSTQRVGVSGSPPSSAGPCSGGAPRPPATRAPRPSVSRSVRPRRSLTHHHEGVGGAVFQPAPTPGLWAGLHLLGQLLDRALRTWRPSRPATAPCSAASRCPASTTSADAAPRSGPDASSVDGFDCFRANRASSTGRHVRRPRAPTPHPTASSASFADRAQLLRAQRTLMRRRRDRRATTPAPGRFRAVSRTVRADSPSRTHGRIDLAPLVEHPPHRELLDPGLAAAPAPTRRAAPTNRSVGQHRNSSR